jgi:hypothetical protein
MFGTDRKIKQFELEINGDNEESKIYGFINHPLDTDTC